MPQHQPPTGGSYSRTGRGKPVTSDDLEAVTQAFAEKFSELADLIVKDSNVGMPRSSYDSAAQTQYLTRRVKRWKLIGGSLLAVVVALVTFVSNLWAYLQGYAQDRAQEIVQAEAATQAAEDLLKRVEANSQRIEKMRTQPDNSKLEANVAKLRRLNALQWAYMTDVISDLQGRRRPRSKPPELVEAENAMLEDP